MTERERGRERGALIKVETLRICPKYQTRKSIDRAQLRLLISATDHSTDNETIVRNDGGTIYVNCGVYTHDIPPISHVGVNNRLKESAASHTCTQSDSSRRLLTFAGKKIPHS